MTGLSAFETLLTDESHERAMDCKRSTQCGVEDRADSQGKKAHAGPSLGADRDTVVSRDSGVSEATPSSP